MVDGLNGFGEVLPYHENRMYLNYEKLDQWGLPTVTFDADIKENERAMRKDMQAQAKQMLEEAGFKNVQGYAPEMQVVWQCRIQTQDESALSEGKTLSGLCQSLRKPCKNPNLLYARRRKIK